jgi:ABC-type nitrate/sulfonate/bicarbonate transport system substrate-binding protein
MGPGFAADKIRVGKAQGSAWIFLPIDVGIAQGIFSRYGLDIEIFDLGGDAKVQQALSADSIDFGLGSGPAMAFLVKGSPAITVAAFAGAPRGVSTMVLTDSPINAPAGLKGKLISVSTKGSLTNGCRSKWPSKRVGARTGFGSSRSAPSPMPSRR